MTAKNEPEINVARPVSRSAKFSPRVSIICPVFNAEPYLAEAVDSVLSQDFGSFQLLLVDDGSSDGSARIAKGFAAIHPERVRLLRHAGGAHRGTSATRNRGLAAAQGDLIAFIDADDRWRPGKLAEQVALIDNMADVDGLFGAANYWASWNGGRDEVFQTGHLQNAKIAPPDALLRWYPVGKSPAPSMSDLMIRRSALESLGGFNETFTGPYEEHTFLVKLYLHSPIYVSSRVWSDYRQHDRSCSAAMAREGTYDEVRERFLRWFQDYLASTGQTDLRIHLALEKALQASVSRRVGVRARRLLEAARLG